MTEHELTAPVDLCNGNGQLNPDARGWSRIPLHRANLGSAWGRRKSWDYWCILSNDICAAITYANVDYVGIASLWVLDRTTNTAIETAKTVPFARGFALGEFANRSAMHFESGGLTIAITEHLHSTRIQASSHEHDLWLDVEVDRPPDHESLNVVIAWSSRRFQFTSKQNVLPVKGSLRWGSRHVGLGGPSPSWGVLDLGRGKWRYSNRWNWASACGYTSEAVPIGLQLGGKWTTGTGYTENGICVDGVIHKLSDELIWNYDWERPSERWRVRSPDDRLNVELVPTYDRYSCTNLGILKMQVHQVFGDWSGTFVDDTGQTHQFSGITGFAEEARNRW